MEGGVVMRFDGPDLLASDVQRLGSQLERVKQAMNNGSWWTLAELATAVNGSEAGVSARLRDLRKPRFGGYRVERRRIVKWSLGLWQYRLLPPLPSGQQELSW